MQSFAEGRVEEDRQWECWEMNEEGSTMGRLMSSGGKTRGLLSIN